jgi:antitoxin (DNA-binding transcriptional repressor) of toxin-antitoxin stability system
LTLEASGSYFIGMKSVGLKVLKNRLSEYVRMASKGEVILVTDRDEVVAELAPPSATRSRDVADALLAEAVRQGWVRPAALPQQGPPQRKPITTFAELMNELEQDRSDR